MGVLSVFVIEGETSLEGERGVPHSPQNLSVSEFSVLHLVHLIDIIPFYPGTSISRNRGGVKFDRFASY
jgi:hypothetical protein